MVAELLASREVSVDSSRGYSVWAPGLVAKPMLPMLPWNCGKLRHQGGFGHVEPSAAAAHRLSFSFSKMKLTLRLPDLYRLALEIVACLCISPPGVVS